MKEKLIKSLIVVCFCFFVLNGCYDKEVGGVVVNNEESIQSAVSEINRNDRLAFDTNLTINKNKIRINQEVKLEITLNNNSEIEYKIGTGDKVFKVYLENKETEIIQKILPITSNDLMKFKTLGKKNSLKEVYNYSFTKQGIYNIWAVAEIYEIIDKDYKLTEYKTNIIEITVE
ncbi:hypothetical protein E0485_03175 [Paenibacillus albiflavus]|uniref:Intracellular proteinase inhibitor BsuPI domain-containing protein n=1 Tax=Paenibacillus albiflavus TaxID=2545760 RepID=A0A4R4EIC2_9BACL|nr:hypothetical protein [Paenibacillus albiflavus]TCZ79886.1 hypothetical protein E0485_03175 [Paenibacillus albiflavus]